MIMKKQTMKSRVLNFVEAKGAARFTEIQEFIVDQNYGEGTYKAAAKSDLCWEKSVNSETGVREWTRTKKANPYRGYYSAAFYKASNRYPWSHRKGYFLTGSEYLVKGPDGLYRVIRQNS